MIGDDRKTLAVELGTVLGACTDDVDRAVQAQYERHPSHKRNLVSVLASTAWLSAMLRSMPDADREA
jgi:hypothetical protein